MILTAVFVSIIVVLPVLCADADPASDRRVQPDATFTWTIDKALRWDAVDPWFEFRAALCGLHDQDELSEVLQRARVVLYCPDGRILGRMR